jgi:hypothetical protein
MVEQERGQLDLDVSNMKLLSELLWLTSHDDGASRIDGCAEVEQGRRAVS